MRKPTYAGRVSNGGAQSVAAPFAGAKAPRGKTNAGKASR